MILFSIASDLKKKKQQGVIRMDGVPRQIRHILAGMSLSALVGIVCAKSVNGPFPQLLRKALIDLRQQVAGFER